MKLKIQSVITETPINGFYEAQKHAEKIISIAKRFNVKSMSHLIIFAYDDHILP
jgi:arabinogalactan endo-1,4-beta-galactosidase